MGKYQPRHMAPKAQRGVDMNKLGSRALVGALTVAMVAPSVLAPISQAVAAEAPAIERVTVDTSFSGAAQRIIKGEGRMTADELKAAIAEAARALDAAKSDAARAEGADAQQATVVANAKGSYDGASAAASQADAAKVAELEHQIEALNAELAAAQQKVEDLNKQSSDASAALEGLETDKAEAEKQQTQAQDALDKAKEALKEAEAALDALGENPTADEQAAYDAAKKAYDEAVADAAAKQQAADEAKATLDALNADLASKQGELATAQGDLAGKQAAKTQADEALATAKASYAATVEAIKGELVADEKAALEAATTEQAAAQAAYDAVKDGEDTEAIEQAKAALDAANEKLAAAQAAYDQAVATAGAQAEAEASAAIQEKQTAADNAAATLADCEDKIATLPGQIEGIDTQIASEQQKVADAQAALDDANELVDQKQEKFDLAEKALEDLVGAQAEWDEKAEPLKEAVRKAEYGVANAEYDLRQAQLKVENIEDQITAKQMEIDRIKDQIDQGTTQVADHADDLFLYIANQFGGLDSYAGTDAYWAYEEIVTGIKNDNPDDDTNLEGDPTDASTFENMLKALDFIDQLNELRAADGLDPLKVSSYMMAISIVNTNWSEDHGQHSMHGNVGENLSWASADPFNGWYYDEKAYAGFLQYTEGEDYNLIEGEDYGYDPAKGDRYDYTAYYTYKTQADGSRVKHYCRKNAYGNTTGHYMNIIRPNYHFVGGGVSEGDHTRRTHGQVFTSGIYHNDEYISYEDWQGFTTDEYRDLINACIEASKDANPALKKQLEQLKTQLAELEQQKAAAEGEVATAQSGVTAADETLAQANKDLAAIGARPTENGLQAAYDKAQQELNDAKRQQSEADQNLTEVTDAVNQKVEELTGRKSELQGQLTTAQNQLEGLRDASEEAARQLADTRAQYKNLTDAAEALDTCEANATEADDAYETASALVKSLNSQITELNGQIEAAENDYDQKKAAAEEAGASEEQIQALNDAKAALEAKKQQVAQLERDRDAAKQTAEEAAAAKAEVDALVDAIMADIEEQTGIKQAAEAALPQAQAKADAWAAALPDEDAIKNAVLNGGTSDDAGVKAALDAAHLAYEEKVVLAEMAADRLAEAKTAYEAALKDKDATAAELAEKKAALAKAQAAYDELVALLPEEKPEQPSEGEQTQVGYKPAEKTVRGDLPQTGDAAGAMIAGVVLAGMAAVGAGAHFRRRNQL